MPLLLLMYRTLYPHRRAVIAVLYGLVAVGVYALAFALRFEFQVPTSMVATFFATAPLLFAVRGITSLLWRVSHGRWRYVGAHDAMRMCVAVLSGSLAFGIGLAALAQPWRVPLSVFLLESLLTPCFTVGIWFSYRTLFHYRRRTHPAGSQVQRVIVIGAGEAGVALVHEMLYRSTGYWPVAFVDDDPLKWGTTVHGVGVAGGIRDLAKTARALEAETIVVAIPSAGPDLLRHLLKQCESVALPVRILPGIREVLAGRVGLDQLRQVRIEDLLGRDPIELELPELAADLSGKAVLITGAAGSIGSELSRQVALYAPRVLILFDHSETSLFYLEMELREQHPEICCVPVVGDIMDAGAVERVFDRYLPERVFHAAAYKHVPMMEGNAREAIRNNSIGTLRVATAAGRHQTEKFILVSTDKAVRPTSMMGRSKRLAEIVILELQSSYPETIFAAVRFGNVLGSNGSVIPIFQRRIREGKPLTVTHPDATRYFMTIPEAVQLVLQASLLPEIKGRIAMLDMGEPVRILDLARNLLRLSGLPVQNNIVFSGLRPGERLHEELAAPDERTFPTGTPRVHLVESWVDADLQTIECVARWDEAFGAGLDDEVLNEAAHYFDGGPAEVPSDASDRVGFDTGRSAPRYHAGKGVELSIPE